MTGVNDKRQLMHGSVDIYGKKRFLEIRTLIVIVYISIFPRMRIDWRAKTLVTVT